MRQEGCWRWAKVPKVRNCLGTTSIFVQNRWARALLVFCGSCSTNVVQNINHSDADLITAVIVPFGDLDFLHSLCYVWIHRRKNARKRCCFEWTICALFSLCANNILESPQDCRLTEDTYIWRGFFSFIIVFYTKILMLALVYCDYYTIMLMLIF